MKVLLDTEQELIIAKSRDSTVREKKFTFERVKYIQDVKQE